MVERLKNWARAIMRDVHALYLASRDPRVPLHTRAFAIFVAAYALSPIDLIPDFIPIIGYLDDLILIPLGIALAVRLIPAEIMDQHRQSAVAAQSRPKSRIAAIMIVGIWLTLVILVIWTAS